jgi:hypothetical protein
VKLRLEIALLFLLCLPSACGPAKVPPPPPETVIGWWVGPTLATTWHSSRAWDARDPRATPTYCSLELEFFPDGTVETNWLNESSWAGMCSFARLPYAVDPQDKSVMRMGTAPRFARACRLRHEGKTLQAACANETNPPADYAAAVTLHAREPEARIGLDALIGTWQSAAFGEDLVSIAVRSDARFAIQNTSGSMVDNGWVSATDSTLEMHGNQNVKCDYRATSRKLTMRCHDGPTKATDRVVVYTRMR